MAIQRQDGAKPWEVTNEWGEKWAKETEHISRELCLARCNAHFREPLEDFVAKMVRYDERDGGPMKLSEVPVIMGRCAIMLRATCQQIDGQSIDVGAAWGPIAAQVLAEEGANY